MTLPASGQISLNQVNVELDLSGTAQIDMNSAAVRTLFGVASGQITMANGYGKANAFTLTISSHVTNLNVGTAATAAGWDGSLALIVVVNSGIWVYSNDTNPAMQINNPCTIKNYGKIAGRGGNGDTQAGSDAIHLGNSCTIENYSGAYIAGGGAGGGNPGSNGSGGGAGGTGTALNSVGANGGTNGNAGIAGTGGGAGGGGYGYQGGTYSGGTPSVGGRILPGVGGRGGYNPYVGGDTTQPYVQGAGGNGGSAGNVGGNSGKAWGQAGVVQYNHGAGGGGWGAAGGLWWNIDLGSPPNGGVGGGGYAGGKAVNRYGHTLTMINNGTIYGAVS